MKRKIAAATLFLLFTILTACEIPTRTPWEDPISEIPLITAGTEANPTFEGLGTKPWNIGKAVSAVLDNGAIYFTTIGGSAYKLILDTGEIRQLFEGNETVSMNFLNVFGGALYGVEITKNNTTDPYSVDQVRFINLEGNADFSPIFLNVEEKPSSVLVLDGILYFSTLESIQAVDMKTRQSEYLVRDPRTYFMHYSDGYIYYQKKGDSQSVYRFAVTSPQSIEKFDLGQEIRISQVYDGNLYLFAQNADEEKEEDTLITQWNGVPRVMEGYQGHSLKTPYKEGFVYLTGKPKQLELVTMTEEDVEDRVLATLNEDDGYFSTITSFRDTLFYTVEEWGEKDESQLKKVVFINENGENTEYPFVLAG